MSYPSQIAAVLADAFSDDPLFVHFFPETHNREQLAQYTFRFIAAHALKKGRVFVTSNTVFGASIWLTSENVHRSLIDQLRFGALAMLLKQGREAIDQQVAASEHMKALHRRLLPEPHLYLSTLGIQKEQQGNGHATQLIRPMLSQANQQQLCCYLDTHNESNLALYRHFGFELAEESVIPNSSVRHWAMIRSPSR